MRFAIAFLLCVIAAWADGEVFRGRPSVRLFSNADNETREKLDGETAEKNECVIVAKGKKYYWASRDNGLMNRIDAPQYTYFVHAGGAGYVKIYTGARKEDAPVEYVESLTQGFEVITYWGRVAPAK